VNFRLIALDVDGTLLNDEHEVTPRVREAVRAAAGKGAEIVLCTGRGSTSALPVLEELELPGTMITHNGASIVDSKSRSVLYETELPHEAIERYLAYLRERNIQYDLNTSFDQFVYALSEEAAQMFESLHCRPVLRDPAEGLPEKLVKVSIFGSREGLDGVERDWKQWQHELLFIRSGDNFIDIHHPDATKGKALEKLAGLRGIPREQVLAIGNYYNDIGMLSFAGLGVAMDNSPPEVKAEAEEVTLSNNEDGVAAILERLGLC
jgi:Cof subfamily protein (haloacid dehalogenase superfamily)